MNRLNRNKRRKATNAFAFLSNEIMPDFSVLSIKDDKKEPMREDVPTYSIPKKNNKTQDVCRLKKLTKTESKMSKKKNEAMLHPADYTLKEFVEAVGGKKVDDKTKKIGYKFLQSLKK